MRPYTTALAYRRSSFRKHHFFAIFVECFCCMTTLTCRRVESAIYSKSVNILKALTFTIAPSLNRFSCISNAWAVVLAQPLHHSSSLKCLNLSNNWYWNSRTSSVPTLEWLDLSISAVAVALAQALHHNSYWLPWSCWTCLITVVVL